MEKNNNSVSPIEGVCWAIAAMLCFVCYCFWGIGIVLGIVVIILLVYGFVRMLAEDDEEFRKFYSENLYLLDLIFSLYGFALASYVTSNCLYGILFIPAYACIAAFFKNRKRLVFIGLTFGIAAVVCIFVSLGSRTYGFDAIKHKYAVYLAEQKELKKKVDSADMVKLSNPYLFYHNIDSLNKVAIDKCNKVYAKIDSLKKKLAKEKSTETLEVDSPKFLRIKRIWQNSNTQPWTYWSYTYVYLHSHFSRYSGRTSLKINGSAKYVGENRLDYINVVLSDNSFYQLKIKDSYEWLIAKEGELVEINDNKLVPLFKK